MDIRNALVILHIIGTALGVGSATVSDYLFFTFTRNGKLTKDEFATLKTVSNVVWVGLFILVLSGLGFVLLYLSGHEAVQGVYSPDKIWAKVTMVSIILINGLVLHRKVLPLFEKRLNKTFVTPAFIKKSPLIFSAGALSAVSWYTTLILGGWRGLTASYGEIMLGYLIILCIAMSISNIAGRAILRRMR